MKKGVLFVRLILTVFTLFFSNQFYYCQSPAGVIKCYTNQADSMLHLNHPDLESSNQFENWLQNEIDFRESNKIIGGVYQIPVVFHVIHSGQAIGTGSNLSYAAILSQMDVFNEDFRRILGTNGYNTNPVGADTQIEFCMAQRRPNGSAFPPGENGVNRINYTTIGATAPPFAQNYVENTIKAYTFNGNVPTATRGWDPAKYLNIWLCDLGGGLLGYAQFPTSPIGGMECTTQAAGTDGVVFLFSSVGKSAVTGFPGPYNEGRTATHEVGHWLGLRHIWGDGNCTATDYCNDTPPANAQNYGCPTGANTCTAAPDQGPDMIENYMDYTDDACMNIFTNDQKQRMRAVLEGSPLRVSLINSDACTPPNPVDASITDVFSPIGDNCVGSITPSVQLRNRGGTNLTSTTISYKIDNGIATTFAWTGTLTPSSSVTLALPAFTATLGTHDFKVYSTLPNGLTDPFPGLDTSAITFVVSNGIVPNYVQDFEGGSFPPDNRWNLINGGNDCKRWSPASGISSSGVFTNNIAQATCYGNSTTFNEDLFTPLFLVPCNATALNFKFDVAYRKRVATSNDRLQVDISTDCGVTWTNIYNKSGNSATPNNLAQNTTLFASEYFPTLSTDWRTETLNLLSYVSSVSDQVRFRFRATSNNGNHIFIDNVKFEGVTPGEINVTQASTDILDGGFAVINSTTVGSSSSTVFTITNTGSTNLTLTNPITITGLGLTLGSGFGTTTLVSGATTTFTINFAPTTAGFSTGNVSFSTNDCDETLYNFVLNCTANVNPPVANFSANPLISCAGTTVTFTNNSTNATTYLWDFGPNATPTTSTAVNPTVTFTAGIYTISLTATNAFGSDIETKTNYISAGPSSGSPLPFIDGFTSSTFPGTNWSLSNANSSPITWDRTTTAGVAPTIGNSLRFDNYTFSDTDDDEARIIPLQFSGLSSATLTFDVAYRRYSAAYIDGLEVLVSTDCGVTFTSVYNKSGTTLASVTGDNTAGFVPTATQWRNESINLTPYVGNSSVIIAFRNLAGNGQYLYIDNVNVSGVNAAPTANFTMSPSSICQGQSVTFTNSSVGATTYNWNFGVGASPATASSAGPHVVTYSTSGTKSISLTVNGGSNSTQNLTVNALPSQPSISASGPTTFCTGGSVTLTASAGSSYLWSNGLTTPSISVSTAGIYTVQVTNASGCQSIASAGTTVVVNALPSQPSISASGATTFCTGGSVTLTASAGSSYLWSNGLTTPSIAVSTAGAYTVQVTNASACQSIASAGTTVVVNALPSQPSISASGPTTFCTGGSVTLTASAGSSYLWSNGLTTPSISVSTAGIYTVQVTNASACQSIASAGTTVVVNALPSQPSISASGPTTFCSGGSVTLTASAGSSYLWSNGLTTPSISVSTAGTYTVQVTNASACQSIASVGTTVVVNALPSQPSISASGPTTFCTGGSVTLTASAGSSYLWSNGLTTPSISVSTAGIYTVQVTNASACQSIASAGTTVVVNALPSQPSISASGPTTFCTGGSVTLTASAGSSYLWSNGLTTPSIAASTAGTYTVQVTNASACQSIASAGTTVVVNLNPIISSGTILNPTSCGSATGVIQVLGSDTGDLAWAGTSTNSLLGISLPQNISNLGAGNYTITFTDAFGCISNSIISTLNDPGAPTAPIVTSSNGTSICAGNSVDLSSDQPGVVWNTGQTSSTINVFTAGTYSATLTIAGCTSTSNSINITVMDLPIVEANNLSVCEDSLPFVLTIASPPGGTYNGIGILSNVFDASIAGVGSFVYTYNFTNVSGCVSEDSGTIEVTDCDASVFESTFELSIYPNPSTGQFQIISDVEIKKLIIFDVTGRMIYLSQEQKMIDLGFLADGTYHVKLLTNQGETQRVIVIRK